MDQIAPSSPAVLATTPPLSERMHDTLARVLADKALEVLAKVKADPRHEMEERAAAAPRPRPFTRALCDAVGEGRTGLIAEIKRRSPSGGEIRPGLDPREVAAGYCRAGAVCLSVLTDDKYFGGSGDDLKAARAACEAPVLRKDFILDPWQVFEARAMGADAVLLILAALSDAQASEMEDVARGLDMAVLAEVHDEEELERALGLETRLIGINNRDLRTLVTDIATTERLAPLVPLDRIPVAESGLRTPDDVRRMADAGARCILVGEHLLRQPDPEAAARALIGAA